MDIAKEGIGNALTSKDRNHVIAVANDIYDETLEKYQSEINAEAGQGDGVYDISAANPTNGNPTPYSDLQAALTAFTDTTKKKGGMTIKFIQVTGNDAKYVQYRYLLSSTDSTDFENEANWEGVTDTLNASNNLVTAKAVYDELYEYTDLTQVINSLSENVAYIHQQKWYSSSGYKSVMLPVAEGQVYDITASSNGNSVIALLTTNTISRGNLVSFAGEETDRRIINAGDTLNITIPNGCTFLYIQTTSSSGTITPTINTVKYKLETDDNPSFNSRKLVRSGGVYAALNDVEEIELDNGGFANYDYYLLEGNTFSTTNDHKSCKFIEVKGGENVLIQANSDNGTYYACLSAMNFSSKAGTFIVGRTLISAGATATFTIPDGTKYLYVYTGVNLSHEPSKVIFSRDLNAKIDNIERSLYKSETIEVNLQQTPTIKGRGTLYTSGGTTKWTSRNSNNPNYDDRGYKLIPVKGGDVITIVNNTEKGSYYACLIDVSTPTYTIGRSDLPLGETTTVKIPEGTNYLYIYTISEEGSHEPQSITIERTTFKLDNTGNSTRYEKLIYDVAFVEDNGLQESMMVKVGKGDYVKYKVNASANMTFMKVYDRAVRNDSHLIASNTATSAGVVEGTYMPDSDGYLVFQSVIESGFTPYFKVYNEGIDDKGKLVFPHQLIFETDSIITVFSSEDEGLEDSDYDSELINYAQIINHKGKLIMLYQAYSRGNSSYPSDNIMMAYYDSDQQKFVKGIPSDILDDGTDVPYPETNLIFRKGTIVGEFASEMIDGVAICRVNDKDYPYRYLANIRRGSNTVNGMVFWMLKSKDLVHWTPMRKVFSTVHDTAESLISYGDRIKVYLRMWDYNETIDAEQRMIGVAWIDIWGNVIVPPSGLFGHGLYNPAAESIYPNAELLVPTKYHSDTNGTSEFETYIIDNGIVRYAPSFNSDKLKDIGGTLDGWAWAYGLTSIGETQYLLYSVRDKDHDEGTTGHYELRLCPIKWITYNEDNRAGH